jgi:hypothetical protein
VSRVTSVSTQVLLRPGQRRRWLFFGLLYQVFFWLSICFVGLNLWHFRHSDSIGAEMAESETSELVVPVEGTSVKAGL